MMNSKGITLIELILAIILLLTIILGATAIDVAAKYFFRSSDTKTRVLNEVSFILEHIQKYTSQAHGWVGFPAVKISNSNHTLTINVDDPNNPSPDKFSDDLTLTYTFNSTNHQLTFNDGSNNEVLSSRITKCQFSSASDNTAVSANITARFDPSKAFDPKTNPEVNLQTTIFFGEHSFN